MCLCVFVTNRVCVLGDGLQTVIDTAEEALGVPKPEDIAQAQDENWKEPTNQLIQDDIIVAEGLVNQILLNFFYCMYFVILRVISAITNPSNIMR